MSFYYAILNQSPLSALLQNKFANSSVRELQESHELSRSRVKEPDNQQQDTCSPRKVEAEFPLLTSGEQITRETTGQELLQGLFLMCRL